MKKEKLLIVVKTYPHPSKSYQELVCTVAMREDGSFVRLYPIDFRYRPPHQWYKKYQWVEMEVEKNIKDARPESYRPNLDSITLLGEPISSGNWEEKKRIVFARPISTLCGLQAQFKFDYTSLGIIKPKVIHDLKIISDSSEWDDKHSQALAQYSLFDPKKKPLQKIPFKFVYQFDCDYPNCPGHSLSITDWELGALYLKEIERFESTDKAAESVRYKFFEHICSPQNDTYFFVGTVYFPYNVWIILGTFYPKKIPPQNSIQASLDLGL